jgi:hypothetical protein
MARSRGLGMGKPQVPPLRLDSRRPLRAFVYLVPAIFRPVIERHDRRLARCAATIALLMRGARRYRDRPRTSDVCTSGAT